MRAILILLNFVLYAIAIVGIGFAVYVMTLGASAPEMHRGAGITAALMAGAIPFLAGTIALGSAVIVSTIMVTSDAHHRGQGG